MAGVKTVLEQFEQIRAQALAELENVQDLKALEDYRIKYLGRKGLIMGLLSEVGKLPREDKPRGGQLANKAKNDVTAAFEERRSRPRRGPQAAA
jgi:phenylalanyl-tRNA synthetase alpha chain